MCRPSLRNSLFGITWHLTNLCLHGVCTVQLLHGTLHAPGLDIPAAVQISFDQHAPVTACIKWSCAVAGDDPREALILDLMLVRIQPVQHVYMMLSAEAADQGVGHEHAMTGTCDVPQGCQHAQHLLNHLQRVCVSRFCGGCSGTR